MDSLHSYNAAPIRKEILFYEMRKTAKLLSDGLSEEEVINQIYSENLFQYPTEKRLKQVAKICIKRLNSLNSSELISAVASQPSNISIQICLYAAMRQDRLLWEFMVTVIGEKYRLRDFTLTPKDTDMFFTRLQEQNETVSKWGKNTITKLKQVLRGNLRKAGYLSGSVLNSVFLDPDLETVIRSNRDKAMLPAFNCWR